MLIRGVDSMGSFSTMMQGRLAAPQTAVPPAHSPASPGVDSADVSATAALLQSIVETASGIPDVDQTRVANLQHALQSDAVQANPQQIEQSFTELEALLA